MTQREIATLLLYYFDKVFINVELITDNNITSPRCWNGNAFEYVGIDDTKCKVCYIRELADTDVIPFDIGGSGKNYNFRFNSRIVVYLRNHEGSSRAIMEDIIKHLSDKDIVIKKVITDANKLVKNESSFGNKITLTGKVFYFAIDVESTQRNFSCCPTVEEQICEPKQSNIICTSVPQVAIPLPINHHT